MEFGLHAEEIFIPCLWNPDSVPMRFWRRKKNNNNLDLDYLIEMDNSYPSAEVLFVHE